MPQNAQYAPPHGMGAPLCTYPISDSFIDLSRHARSPIQRVREWQPARSRAASPDPAIIRRWCSATLRLPVLELLWAKKGPPDWYQLFRAEGTAPRMHQRRQEHVFVLEPGVWVPTGGYGHPHRRPAEPHQSTDEAEHPACDALAGEGCSAERLSLLPLLW